MVPSDSKWQSQTAYQIVIVATSGTVVFDSGRVPEPSSVAVVLKDFKPTPNQKYSFKVRCWSNAGKVSDWSEPGKFLCTPSGTARFFISPQDRLISRAEAPTRTQQFSNESQLLDFGRAMFGNAVISGQQGSRVVVRLGEALSNGRINRNPGGNVRFHEEQVSLDNTGRATLRLTPKDARRMPASIGPVMPFRYIEIEGQSLTDIKVTRSVVTVPFNATASSFKSSDETLNAVWKLCKDTMEATSFCGVYVDGDRERLPYEADAYINMLGHYSVDRSYATARHTHELLMLQPTWPTEWILFSVLMAWQDYLHTGDVTSIERHVKTIDAKSLRALAGPDGLISTVNPTPSKAVLKTIYRNEPIRDIVDWPQGERDNVELMPVNTIINAFYLAALRDLAQMYEAIGFDLKAKEIHNEFERVYTVFQAKCYDPVLERYIDGPGSKHASLHANMVPLAFDLVPPGRIGSVGDYIAARGMACSVYGAQFLLDALFRAGRASDALSLLTSRSDRSWGHMIYDVGTTIALEAWDTRYKPNQDWNHAWGAAPANLIPRWLVGVWPISPGAATIRIAPQPANLMSFEANVPTIRGAVGVTFQQSRNQAQMSVSVPVNASGEVTLPYPANHSIREVFVGNRKVPVRPSFAVRGGEMAHFRWNW
jgi:hypothetical protein